MSEDLDFSEFDEKTQITFTETYAEFIKCKGIDTVMVDKKRLIRAHARDVINRETHPNVIEEVKTRLKHVPVNNISSPIVSPHEILNYGSKTSVQQLVDKHVPFLPIYGSFAYSCSCGSGKTIAGLQIINALQCRTLIVSSRNAVNDQWKICIEQMYPDLIIETKGKQTRNGVKIKNPSTLADIYIDTPQYLGAKIEKLSIRPSLIIFDEVHSLLSKGFIRVLLFPLVKVISGEWDELPYMIALSATYPPLNSPGYKSLMKLFGKAFRTESDITKIPVHIWDYYEHFSTVQDDGTHKRLISGIEARGAWDTKYSQLDDNDIVEYFADAIDGVNADINAQIERDRINQTIIDQKSIPKPVDEVTVAKNMLKQLETPTIPAPPTVTAEDIASIDPTDPNHKGIIMTYTIDSSIYAAIYVHHRWNVDVLLIRAVDEPDYYFPRDRYMDFKLKPDITIDTLKDECVGIKCDYKDHLTSACIIVGTFHRLKEGFSVQNITWGICTKFVWSYISRVQLVGRVRRLSNDPELNSHKRILLVSSGVRPSTLKVPRAKKPYKWLYDMTVESTMFKFENYIRI